MEGHVGPERKDSYLRDDKNTERITSRTIYRLVCRSFRSSPD